MRFLPVGIAEVIISKISIAGKKGEEDPHENFEASSFLEFTRPV
jgi:hypothetical protein